MDAGLLYQQPLLTNVANNYHNRQYIADRVCPAIGVPKLDVRYLEFDRKSRFMIPDDQYNQDGRPNMIAQLKATKKSLTLQPRALADYIDELEQSQAGPGLPVETLKTERLTDAALLAWENRVQTLLRDTAIITQNSTLAGNTQWSDYVNSDPGDAILTAADTMIQKPNKFICSRPVLTKLRRHPKILDVTKYTSAGKVPIQALADYLEVDEIISGEAFYDSANQGQAESRQYIWGKDALLAYLNPQQTPLFDQPSLCSTARLDGAGPGQPFRVFRAVDPTRGTGAGAVFVKVEGIYQPFVQAPLMGYLFKNAVA